MKYTRFEQLPVCQAAIDWAAQVYEFTARTEFKNRYSLRDQIERAAVSVSNNIAEGFERGSAGEVRSILCLIEKIPPFSGLESDILNLKSKAESVSRQLGAWIQSLLNSGMKGQRYVTDKVRTGEQKKVERNKFLKKLERIRNGSDVSGDEA